MPRAAAEGESDSPLGISIHQQDIPPSPGEGVAEIDADSRFSDASFLTGSSEGDHGADVSGL